MFHTSIKVFQILYFYSTNRILRKFFLFCCIFATSKLVKVGHHHNVQNLTRFSANLLILL